MSRRHHFDVKNEIEKNAKKCIKQINEEKIKNKIFMHIDMDMFFCAVEIRDNPLLREEPVAVGGPDMICTTNYVARRYGVRAAMPGFIGLRLCPTLKFIKPNFDKYRRVSEDIQEVLRDYDPFVRCYSCDEASLDITNYLIDKECTSRDSINATITEIRHRIFQRSSGLTCSAGVGPSRLVAKILVDQNKPDGQSLLLEDEVSSFMKQLSVRKLPGVGKSRERILESIGIHNCDDIMNNVAIIKYVFTAATALFLYRSALGIDGPQSTSNRKSFSSERTFKATEDINIFMKSIKASSESLANELIQRNMTCQSISLKVKSAEFDVRTYTKQLASPTASMEILIDISNGLLSKHLESHRAATSKACKIRLLGIRCSSLLMCNNKLMYENYKEGPIKLETFFNKMKFGELKPILSSKVEVVSNSVSSNTCDTVDEDVTTNNCVKKQRQNMDESSYNFDYINRVQTFDGYTEDVEEDVHEAVETTLKSRFDGTTIPLCFVDDIYTEGDMIPYSKIDVSFNFEEGDVTHLEEEESSQDVDVKSSHVL